MIRINKAGSGTYGIVYNAKTPVTDGDKSRNVAIKRNIIDESVDFSGSIKELDLLNRLKGHPYIVKLLSVSFGNPLNTPNSPISRANDGYKEDYLYFIFEQANQNVHSLIYSDTPISYLKLAMVQMFLGLEYMHFRGVIHRDIKPSNLLWFVSDGKAALKICDFGLAKVNSKTGCMTPKVVTCWYRAPEICAHDPKYDYKSDIWSAGCVLFEMVSKKALLFNSTDDDVKLLSKIIGLVPNPSHDDIFKLTKGKIKLTADASPRKRLSFSELINLSDQKVKEFNEHPENGATYTSFLDLLENILVLNPEKRFDASQVLDHEFFKPYENVIQSIRKEYLIPPKGSRTNIIVCKERSWIIKAAFLVFNNRSYLNWYKHTILFQSIDIFDRFLTYVRTKTTKRLTEDANQGRYLTRYEAELYYVVCLYVSIKYFTTLHVPISFTELASETYKTPEAMEKAEEFEKKLIGEILEFTIYRDTVYEKYTQDKNRALEETEIRDLLEKYGNVPSDTYLNLDELVNYLTK